MSNNTFKFKVGDILKYVKDDPNLRYLVVSFDPAYPPNGAYMMTSSWINRVPLSKEWLEARFELCTTEEAVLAKLEGLI